MYRKFLEPRRAIPAMVALLIVLAVVAFGVACLRTGEVVDKGELLPYVKGYTIYKIRVLDRYEFFVEPDYRLRGDAINTYILVGIAFISLTFAVVFRILPTASTGMAGRFFICMFIGTNYLAADEFLGIHETLGHNMQFLTAIVPFDCRPDVVIILLYGIPALLFLFFFRKTLLASKAAIFFFVAAVAMFGVGAVSDALKLPIEEICEIISSICIISGVLSLGVHHIRESQAPQNAISA